MILTTNFESTYSTVVARSINLRQLPLHNPQIIPAGQHVHEGVTSDVDVLAGIFDKIEQSVAEDFLTGETIKKRRRRRVVSRASSK